MEWYLKVLQNYATFDGRARRKEYWMYILFNIIITIVLAIIDNTVFKGMPYLQGIYGIAVLLPGIAVTIRRLHDIGKSGWAMLIIFIPLIGAILLLVWNATDSTPGPNQYGPNPKGV